MKSGFWWKGILCLFFGFGSGPLRGEKAPSVATEVDPAAWQFAQGKWGSSINGQTFQQEALVSHKGWQYAAYYGEGGHPCLARRKLPAGAWQVLRFRDYVLSTRDDSHNVAVVGICPEDGTIHLAYDHHVNALRYRRSVPGLADHPDQFEWKSSQFGSTTSELEKGVPVRDVTYPMFFPNPEGGLQLLYRTGSSGDGEWHLAAYRAQGGWKNQGLLFSSQGQYQGSASRCAYPNPLRYGPEGRLHLTWSWRERPVGKPLDLRTNHDLCYAYSHDLGTTWKNNAGNQIAELSPAGGRPITIDSPGIVVREIPFLWGQMNTTCQMVGKDGTVHVIGWQNPRLAVRDSLDLNEWRYFYYRGRPGENWRETPLPFWGRKPQVGIADEGMVFALYVKGADANYHGKRDPGGRLQLALLRGEEWKEVWQSENEFIGEPLLDAGRLETEGFLSVYLQKKTEAGILSPLWVLDFSPESLKSLAAKP